MNTGLTPTGLPAYLAYASRLAGNPPPRRLGLQNGLRTALAGSSHRLAESSLRCSFIHELCYGLAVHLRQLSTLCRHDAVAFGHRPVIRRPDGDFHPVV